MRQDLEEAVAKLLTDEGIDDRVDAAVGKAQDLRDREGCVDTVPSLTGLSNSPCPHESVAHQCDVVGQPADEEDQHHSKDDLHGPLLLSILGLQEGVDGDAIAEEHHQEGQDKAECLRQDPKHHPPLGRVLAIDLLIAHSAIVG